MKIILLALTLVMQSFSAQIVLAADTNPLLAKNFTNATDEFAKYNGVSGDAPLTDSLTSADYEQKNLELAAMIWADSEISQKLCKPVGDQPPKSYSNWWVAVNKYVEAEKTRGALTTSRLTALAQKAEALNKESNFQVEAMKLQIEELETVIDMISGSTLSSGAASGSNLSISRIGAREELMAAVVKAQEDTLTEDKTFNDAYNTCLAGVETSASVAGDACRTSTIGCARTKTECGKDGCSTVPDPVPGSCELKAVSCQMVYTSIPLFKKIPLVDIKALYTLAPVPSKEINQRLLRILNVMNQQVNIFFPKSTDSKYDWITPLQTCVAPIEKVVKADGVMCPTDAKEGKDYKKDTFDQYGRSDDLFAELHHYIVGMPGATDTATFLDSKAYFNELRKGIVADPKSKNASDKEIESMTLAKFWSTYVTDYKYSQNYIAGKDPGDGIDQKAALEYATSVMKKNNETDWTCSARSCVTPLVQTTPVPKAVVPDYAKVTESAKTFLEALGIKDSLGQDMNLYLSDKWNTTDLSIGQSYNRQFYFKYIEEILKQLIASDRNKLAALLLQRDALINNYNSLVNGLGKSTNTTSTASSVTQTAADADTKSTKNLAIDSRTTNLNLSLPDLGNLAVASNALQNASSGLVSYVKGGSLSGSSSGLANAIKYSKSVNDKIKKSKSKIADLQRKRGSSQSDSKKFNEFSKSMKAKINANSLAKAGSMFSTGGSNNGAADAKTVGASESNSPRTYGDGGGYGHGSFGNSGGAGGYEEGVKVGMSPKEAAAIAQAAPAVSTEQAMNEDQRLLENAILARNKKLGDYDANENDSIFTLVRKAYIRNYDKLKSK